VLVGLLTPSWGANKAEKDLFMAAIRCNLAQVKSLIAAGVNLNAKDDAHFTAVMYALRSDHLEVVNLLRQAEAKE
jgi:ankyrin repeat protein